MAQKIIGRNTGNSGRVNVSGSELDQLGLAIGSAVDVDVAESKDIAQALIDSKDTERFLIVTPIE
jgi:antitoxin component of MazEF toxin-antitoxin module